MFEHTNAADVMENKINFHFLMETSMFWNETFTLCLVVTDLL